MLIGREKEQQILKEALTDEYSQFIAVYGRRRVGKTFLIRESYDYHFTFQFTGAAKTHTKKQLARFRMALKEHGLTDLPPVLTNWMTAFSILSQKVCKNCLCKDIFFLTFASNFIIFYVLKCVFTSASLRFITLQS